MTDETRWKVRREGAGDEGHDIVVAENVVSYSGDLEFYDGSRKYHRTVALYSRGSWISAVMVEES